MIQLLHLDSSKDGHLGRPIYGINDGVCILLRYGRVRLVCNGSLVLTEVNCGGIQFGFLQPGQGDGWVVDKGDGAILDSLAWPAVDLECNETLAFPLRVFDGCGKLAIDGSPDAVTDS